MNGGKPGEAGFVVLRPGTEDEEVTGMYYASMGTNEVLSNNSGGGGGWGDPYERDPQKVLADVRSDYVSIESAREDYGVVIDPDALAVDEAATQQLRAAHAG
jgi:N-methylhydantoinase B